MARLTACEGRVVASLVEKHLTIPQQYPLTLHALVGACNQSSSREPVTAYRDDEVLAAVESLKRQRLVRAVLPSHGRSVVRYRHVMDEAFGLDAPQLAALSVLQLRGPQTAAELRARTERMAEIGSIDHELDLLSSREEPLVERVARRAGQKEDRWVSLLAAPFGDAPRDPVASAAAPALEDLAPAPAAAPGSGRAGAATEVDELRRDIVALGVGLEAVRAEVGALRSALEELRTSLGG
ncbi:MAG TPA: DUF480 domain-containing protein [Acidimicrobiales bacterium]|nr:DUF480 domain-containing protein [Acidimicrobiales bacterium]